MADTKVISELTELATVDKTHDWVPVVDVDDDTESDEGTTKKAVVDQFVGPQGDAATVDVGTTTTGDPGSNASVVNSGSTSAAVLDFTIPRGATGATGATGAKGDKGDTGDKGDAATVTAGTTTTGNPGTNASVVNSGSTSAAVFDFTIPRGATGATGSQGIPGTDGDNAYCYIAYASDASGTDFTTIFDADLDYIAILSTDTEITSPQASDFAGLWKNYKGAQGIQGIQGIQGTPGTNGTNGTNGTDGDDAYVYIAYASDTSGTGFTMTFNALLDYIAIKTTTTPIVSPSASDFTGLWKN